MRNSLLILTLVHSAAVAAAFSGLRGKLDGRNLAGGGNFTGDDDSFFYHATNDIDNPGSLIWTGEGNGNGLEAEETDVLCFSAEATVKVQDTFGQHQSKTMTELAKGDLVLTDKNQYEKVYAFAHKDTDKSAQFLTIYTEDERLVPLEVSAEHLLFLEGRNNPVRADSIRVGDNLQGASNAKKVAKIGKIKRKGIYAPLTVSGTLVVNGVVASNYASLIQDTMSAEGGWVVELLQENMHRYIHQGMSPFRLYCSLSEENLCTVYSDFGKPYFVEFGVKITNAVVAKMIGLQLLYLAGFFAIAGTTSIVEKIRFGPCGFLSLICVTYLLIQRKKTQFSKTK